MYTIKDIVKIFEKFGYKVTEKNYYHIEDISDDEKLEMIVKSDVNSQDYDFVFTVNYSPVVSKVCYKNNCRYVSWTYDTPMNLFSKETLDNPNNYIFIFDKGEYRKYKGEGFDTVYYLPLASGFAMESVKSVAYRYDISFLGNLYRSTYPTIKEKLDKYHTGFLEGIISAQRDVYGNFFVLDVLKEQK